MRIQLIAVIASLFLPLSAGADSFSSPPPDFSGLATKGDVTTIQQQIPQPATSAPPSEMVGGDVGTPGRYRPADAKQPRITRSKTVLLASDGTATFDWASQGALILPVQVALAPVYAGSGIPTCWVTAASATSVSLKCAVAVTPQNLTLNALTVAAAAGISMNPYTGTLLNMQVGVIVLPSS